MKWRSRKYVTWVQELGRAGRDGKQACATILYRRTVSSHANAWIFNNLHNKERCNYILMGYSEFGDMYRDTLLVYAKDDYYLTYLMRKILKLPHVGPVVMYVVYKRV